MKQIITVVLFNLCSILMNQVIAQTNIEERIPIKIVGNQILVSATVGGEEGSFVLDTRGRLALTESAARKRVINAGPGQLQYQRHGIETLGFAVVQGFLVGESIFARDVRALIIKDQPLLSELKAEGFLGIGSFINHILTIDKKSSSLILSNYYKPDFIKLANRGDFKVDGGNKFILSVVLDGKEIEAQLDLDQVELFKIGQRDKSRFEGFAKKENVSLQIGHSALSVNGVLYSDKEEYSLVGRSILDSGVMAFDVAKGKYYFQSYDENYKVVAVKTAQQTEFQISPGKVNPVTQKYFLEHIYDYRLSNKWKLKGDKPVVIDFWASWCGPCLKMMPVMEELAAKYKDQVLFYKVNIDKEGELKRIFQADAIPLLIFGPNVGTETRDIGADTKEKIEERIMSLLK